MATFTRARAYRSPHYPREKKSRKWLAPTWLTIVSQKKGNGGERKRAMKPKGEWAETIDLSILYALFSHFRPCDGTLEKSFFQMSSYTRASTGICMHRLWSNKWHIPCKSITWYRRELAWVRGWGSPSSKYEHRRVSSMLRNIWNIRICMGKKAIVSVTYGNERISIKKSLPYIKCVTPLLCGPWTNL